MRRMVPSLVDLCVQTAVDNVRYLGDVGETDIDLLGRILPHCSLEQLKHVEKSTEGRDLSQVTDRLWKRFYQIEFGDKSLNQVVERMKQKNVTFKWKKLYEAKSKEVEETQQRSFQRIKELYQNENAKRQSRQVQVCTKVPPSSNKRNFYGSGYCSNIGNTKSPLMKKAKMEFVNSREVKNLAAMKNKSVQRSRSQVPSIRKPSGGFSSMTSSSRSKYTSRARGFAGKWETVSPMAAADYNPSLQRPILLFI
ncbi:transcription elongation factor B polypeptide 3 [Capsicum chacoense]